MLRPWYLVAVMALTWLVGVLGATSSCSYMSYLRGEQEAMDRAEQVADEARSPIDRLPAVIEKARLVAMAQYYPRAFPITLAQTMLYVVLALLSGAAIAGRRGARRLAIQVVIANALLALLAFAVMAPVRYAVADAVARDALQHGGAFGEMEGAGSMREAYLWAERLGLGLMVIGVYGGALFALTRRRTKEFFEAVAAAMAEAEQTDE